MNDNKEFFQIVWGGLLILFGIGMFFRIPQVMPRIQEFECFSSGSGSIFAYFSLYLIGILLIGGGCRKIYLHFHPSETGVEISDPEKK